MDLEQELYRYIVSRYLQGRAPVGFDLDTHLIDSGVLDLAACLNLVCYAERVYAIRFETSELVPEQFASVHVFARAIERKIAAQNRPPLVQDARYAQLAEQIRIYRYDLGTVLAPYVMRRAPSNFRSDLVNTDAYGYRFSHDAAGVVDSKSWWQRKHRALVIGNSFVFGRGATCDQNSVVSALNAQTDFSFLNLGILAGNSTQELIAAIPFLQDAECVLICAGFANINLNLLRTSAYDLYGCFAGEELFAKLSTPEFQDLPGMFKRPAERLRERFVEQAPSAAEENNLTPEEIQARLNRAMELQRRDLQFLVRACNPSTSVFFALQPIAGATKPNLTEEEEYLFELYSRTDQVWSKVVERHSVRVAKGYSQMLSRQCADLGVPYTDLNDLDYEGWCFIDYGHMTDNGYRQVAQHLAEWMKGVAGKQGRQVDR